MMGDPCPQRRQAQRFGVAERSAFECRPGSGQRLLGRTAGGLADLEVEHLATRGGPTVGSRHDLHDDERGDRRPPSAAEPLPSIHVHPDTSPVAGRASSSYL
jgi:hypothetical protein